MSMELRVYVGRSITLRADFEDGAAGWRVVWSSLTQVNPGDLVETTSCGLLVNGPNYVSLPQRAEFQASHSYTPPRAPTPPPIAPPQQQE